MGNESSNSISVLKLLNQTVSEPHYLFHFLTFFSYLVIRISATPVLAPHLTQTLLRRVTLSHSLIDRLFLFVLFMYVIFSFSGDSNDVSFYCFGFNQGTYALLEFVM
jgi:hypothetical protein